MISLENERIIKLEKYNSATITYLYKFGKLILSHALFDRRENTSIVKLKWDTERVFLVISA